MGDDAYRHRPAGWREWLAARGVVTETRHLLVSPSGRLLVGAVAAIAALTVIGLLALWPYGSQASGVPAAGGTIPATVQQVAEKPCAPPDPLECRSIVVAVEGRRETLSLGPSRHAPAVAPGDRLVGNA